MDAAGCVLAAVDELGLGPSDVELALDPDLPPLHADPVLLLRVLAATLLLSAFLLWADGLAWVDVHSKLTRLLQFAGVMLGAVLIYFGALALSGFKLRQLVRR